MKIYRLMFASALLFAFAVPRVFAAAVIFESGPRSSGADGSFIVSVYLNTEGKSVNGIEGVILFPVDILRAREVRTGNSSVALWIEAPRPKAGAIPFTGMIPGGVSGSKLFLFSIIFSRQSSGAALLTANLLNALENDGTGNELSVRKTSIVIPALSISPKTSGAALLTANLLNALENDGTGDVLPPDVFNPLFGRDDGLFGGDYFVAFIAQDKESGVSYYEVQEEGYAPVRAISPYLLQNQKLDKKVVVTAFDGSGNARVAVAYPPAWRPWYRRYAPVFAVAVLFSLLAFMYRRRSSS